MAATAVTTGPAGTATRSSRVRSQDTSVSIPTSSSDGSSWSASDSWSVSDTTERSEDGAGRPEANTTSPQLTSSGLTPKQARLLLRKILVGPGCWMWTAARNQRGYGLFNISRGRQQSAHRCVYRLLVGPIPPGAVLDHRCRNTSCVRPDHLDVVNQRENVLRGFSPASWNALKRHCPSGHPYDAANTYRTSKGRQCRTCRAARAQYRASERKTAP